MKNSEDYIKEYCEDKCHLFSNGCPNDYGDSMTKVPCYALSEIMRREIEYTFEDLKSDLKRLDKKIDGLEGLKLSDIELEKIVAPVYLVAQVNLIAKYLGVRVNKSYEPLIDDEKQER